MTKNQSGLLEIFFVFALLMSNIWLFHKSYLGFFLVGALIFLNWFNHKYDSKKIGLVPKTFKMELWLVFTIVFLICFMVILGFFFNKNFSLDFWKFIESGLIYSVWGILQQLTLVGYFGNRFADLFGKNKKSIVLTGFLFFVLHLPNPVLMAVTFFTGMLATYYFYKSRNIYLISLAHGFIAVAIEMYLPQSWHNQLMVGPGL